MKRTFPFRHTNVAAPRLFALRHGVAASLVSLAFLSLTPVAHAVDSKAAKFYEDALTRFEKKDLDGAIIQLKNALQIDKNMLPVQVLLGRALLRNGEVVAAEVALLEALRIGVNRAEIIIPLAQVFSAQGKQRLVLEQQQFAQAGLPANVQLQLLLVKAAASSDIGDPRLALKLVEEARVIDSKAPGVWLAEVPIRIRAGQFREALDAADRGLALALDSAEGWYQKGSVLHVSGKLPDALAAYDRSLKIEAEHVEARIARAGIYIDQGRVAEAGKDIAELLRLAPGEPRAAYLNALLAERDNKPDVSKAALKDVTELLDPVPPEFIRYRPQLLMLNGLAHFGLNQREKAKQYLELFQKVQSNTPASKLLAQIYIGESNVDRAIEVLESYLKTQGGDGQAMTLLGTALMAKGQHVRAASLMQRALLTRDAPEFRTVLGLSLLKSGQTSNAVTELELALKGDPKQTQAAVSLIGLYLRSGQAARAVTIAESLVKQQPSNSRYFNLLGTARADGQNLAGAKAAFEESVRLDDAFMQPKLNLARLEIASNAFEAAQVRLTAILTADNKNAEAMFEMAALAERKGQKAETQRWLEKANDLSGPRETRWGLALSGFHLRNGRASAALEAAKRVSAKAPDDLQVLMGYARAQIGTGDTIGAKSTLISATRVADYNPQAQLEIALLQVSANNLGGATYSLDKALSNQPDFLPAQALLADVELRQGEPAKSEKRAREIVAKYPKRAVGHSLLGDVAMARGQFPSALESYRRAHQLEPSTETLLRLFRVLSPQDGGKWATQLATDWLKTYPKNITVQKALADHYARTGNFSAAKTTYETVLTLAPDDAGTLNNLANALLRLKDPKAVTVAEQAVAKAPGNALAIDTLGWILFQNGQIDRALQLLRDARLREPGNPEIKYHLATVLAKTGRKAEAKEELEAALKASNRFDGASDAAKLLTELK